MSEAKTTSRGTLLKSLACLTIAAGVFASGCGKDASLPPLGRVSGKVTYNGKPVTQGHIVFTPVEGKGGETGQTASGEIESNGNYEMTTFNTGDGALVGQHIVTVQVREGDMPKPKADGTISYVLPKLTIPTKYATPDKSPLRSTIKEGNNTFDIDLKD